MKDGVPSLEELIEGVKFGDPRAQKKLYETYYSYAKTVCLHYGSSEEESVEILNDGFLSIFKHIELYDNTYSFKTWMRKIMINKAIDYFRKYHKLKTFNLENSEVVFFSAEDLHTFDAIEDLVPYLQKLSPRYRMVLNLHILEDLSHEEIATKLNISAGTSRSNLFRAIENIRKLICHADSITAQSKR